MARTAQREKTEEARGVEDAVPERFGEPPSLTGVRTGELVEEIRRRRSSLTDEDRTGLLAAALDLCRECAGQVTAYFPAQGYTFAQYARRQLWKYLRAWAHGQGCPPEA